jgi:hypothetical protein
MPRVALPEPCALDARILEGERITASRAAPPVKIGRESGWPNFAARTGRRQRFLRRAFSV